VDFSSAQRLAGDNSYKVEDANHMEVCKPPSKEHPSYKLLLQFIITCRKVARECDEALQEVHDLPQSMFGLESYVERLETLVTSEGSDAPPQYVGVWGMGGVGKTLLLQRVYGSPKVHVHFQGAKFVWLTVGQAPDIMALYRTLSAKLGFGPENTVNSEDYKLGLYNQFRQRRVFLVLDDVWQEEAFDSLDLAKGKGSVTLLSTRNLSLLERASPHIRQEHMTPLSKEDSWSLFCVHAFRSPSNVPCELKALAESMTEECQGLPLALKVIGRAMFGKTSPGLQWEPLLKKLRESRMQERTVEEKLYERLKLGYDLLSEDDWRLKDCFLYFAAFPEDWGVGFNNILWGWIGEGLIPGSGGDDARADAFSLLNKLWRRSFIESNVGVEDIEVEQLWFKLHDVMRDLAFYILENDRGTPPAKQLYLYRAGQNLENFPPEWEAILKAQRLSLQQNKLKKLPERRICAPDLLSLLLCGNPVVSLPGSFLRSFQKLRVLDLSGGHFWYLPEELGDLKDLICLNLSDCRELVNLPEAGRKLHMLKYLNVEDCHSLKYLPSGIVGLTSLEDLCMGSELIWAKQTASGMARAQSLCDIFPTVGASLEDIYGLTVLTKLNIFGKIDGGMELSHNISALTNLKNLKLALKNVKTLPAGMAYSLKQLQELDLCYLEELENLPKSFTSPNAFPALIQFRIAACFVLVEFPEVDEGALPNLKRLDIHMCHSLETLPLSLQVLTSLRQMNVAYCGKTMTDSCRINCEKSSIWRRLDMSYSLYPLHDRRNERTVTDEYFFIR
jgi:Leucine-rich repeat (LRR) protein